MRITVELDDSLLQPALDLHLNTGIKMQDYVIGAIQFYNECRALEAEGRSIGHGDKDNFARYNKVMNVARFIER